MAPGDVGVNTGYVQRHEEQELTMIGRETNCLASPYQVLTALLLQLVLLH